MASVSGNPLIFGEVLFDCFPDGREELGGAPFNVAWNLQALGLSPMLISRVGNDVHGRLILDMAASWGMDSAGLQIDELYPTGKVRIELADGEPNFTILPDQAYDHIVEPAIAHLRPAFLYHGSLALRNETSQRTLNMLKQKLRCPVFLDVNLRKPWWDAKQVKALVRAATWLKLNDSELDTLFPGREKMAARCRDLLHRFDLDAVFITLGAKGAVALKRDNVFVSARPQEKISIIDTVGAGDAFSAVLLLGLVKGWPLDTAMQRAQDFASAVVGLRGAVSREKEFYQTFKENWDLA